MCNWGFNQRYENNEFSIMFEELNVPFTYGEFSKACSQLHTNKSAGPDKLINEFFIYGKDYYDSLKRKQDLGPEWAQ